MPLFEKSENNLRNAYNTSKKMFEEADRAYKQAIDELKKLWEMEGKPDKDYLSWITEQSKMDSNLIEQRIINLKDTLLKI